MKNKRLENYLHELNNALARGDSTEHTHRPALKTLLESLKDKITATNEPKRVACGAPDFAISRKKYQLEQVFGYIECKDIGVDLKREEKSEQLKRYRAAIDTLILTDYINFRFYQNGELIETAVLAKEGKGGKFVTTESNEVLKLFSMFFASEPDKAKMSFAPAFDNGTAMEHGELEENFYKFKNHSKLKKHLTNPRFAKHHMKWSLQQGQDSPLNFFQFVAKFALKYPESKSIMEAHLSFTRAQVEEILFPLCDSIGDKKYRLTPTRLEFMLDMLFHRKLLLEKTLDL